MNKLVLAKNGILFLLLFYAIFFIVALWSDILATEFFVKASLTFAVILVFLGVFYYMEYWDASSKDGKDKNDYFSN